MAYKQGSTSSGDGAWTFVSSATASTSATIEFTGLSTDYMYMFVLQGVFPVTDNVTFLMRTSSDNGSTFDSTSGDYARSMFGVKIATSYSTGNSASNRIQLTSFDSFTNLGNASTEGCNYIIYIYNPSDTVYTHTNFIGSYRNTSDEHLIIKGNGTRNSAADVDAVQFSMTSGSISSGTFKLYSLAAS